MDHEGNVSPWVRMAEDRGVTVRWLPFNRDTWRIEPENLRPLLSSKTRLLALNYASNLTGSINPVAELTKLAKEAGALVYVDAVQFVPHGLAEVAKLDCDFLACSSYKFFGPHLGVLWGGSHFSRSSMLMRCAAGRKSRPDDTNSARRRPNCSPAWPPQPTTSSGWASRPGYGTTPRKNKGRLSSSHGL